MKKLRFRKFSNSPKVIQPAIDRAESGKPASKDFTQLLTFLIESYACSVHLLPQEGYSFHFSCSHVFLQMISFPWLVGVMFPWFPYLSAALSLSHCPSLSILATLLKLVFHNALYLFPHLDNRNKTWLIGYLET